MWRKFIKRNTRKLTYHQNSGHRYKKKNRRHHIHKAKSSRARVSHQNHTHYYEWNKSEHPGCEVSGFSPVGSCSREEFSCACWHAVSFMIENPQMTNTSLSFGRSLR
mmetsp:Transcript_19364/g.21368  ORF Transcript_19364/g.21368 Transcript_19364/m.21368 type:complete len:107 (-) Transcript_19364:423-743(-)